MTEFLSGATLVVVCLNCIGIAFVYGKLTERVDNHDERLVRLEKAADANQKDR